MFCLSSSIGIINNILGRIILYLPGEVIICRGIRVCSTKRIDRVFIRHDRVGLILITIELPLHINALSLCLPGDLWFSRDGDREWKKYMTFELDLQIRNLFVRVKTMINWNVFVLFRFSLIRIKLIKSKNVFN